MPTSADQPTNQPTRGEQSFKKVHLKYWPAGHVDLNIQLSRFVEAFCEHFILFSIIFDICWERHQSHYGDIPSLGTLHMVYGRHSTMVWAQFFSPGKEKLIFAWKRFLCRPLNPQFERISMHGMFYPLGNIPIPAIRCSAIDKAIHPNGIWRQWGVGSG